MTDICRWAAPGRVNLIGEHLDYNGGPVLPMAIDKGTTVKARIRDDDRVHVWTTHGGNQHTDFGLDAMPGDVDGWAAYVAGVFWVLRESGHPVPAFDLVVDSDLPAGAGLSSSAALQCAVGGAINDACALRIEPLHLALLMHRAETDFVGVPSGSMDQIAVVCGQAGNALFINGGATPPSIEPVPVDWTAADLELVVIDTGVKRGLNDGRYAQRRTECEEAAELLDLPSLAAAGPDAVLRIDDATLKARTRHVITETARTRGARRAIMAHNWKQFGAMLTASHESLRDDFQVSCMELDLAVDSAIAAGALGARMTGAGFGGCAIALIPVHQTGHLIESVSATFEHTQRSAPHCFVARPSEGMHRLSGN